MIREVLYYIEGLDKSILQLNECLINGPFEFKLYTLNEFKEDFKKIIKEDEDHDDTIIQPFELEFSFSLATALSDSRYFNQPQILKDQYVVFLRYVELEEN